MLLVAALQTFIPIIVLIWLIQFPAKHALVYMLQVSGISVFLFYIKMVGIWMLPPWWTPYLFGLLFLSIVATQVRYRIVTSDSTLRLTAFSAFLAVLYLVITICLCVLSFEALKARHVDDEVVNIAMPFNQGRYFIVQGGANRALNEHFITLEETIPRYKAWVGQSKGIDIVVIDKFGFRATGLQPTDPAQYYAFGTSVLAPCNGSIAISVDGVQDMQVPQMDRQNMVGNHVMVKCKDFFVLMAHFKQGSVLVKAGQRIEIGQKIAEIGNSGNTGEPHLHIHAQRNLPKEYPMSGIPLFLTINKEFYIRNDRMIID